MSFWERMRIKLRGRDSARGYVCDCCGAEVFYYPLQRLCGACEESLQRNEIRVCKKCGRKTVTEGVCLSCKRNLPKFSFGLSPFVYQGKTALLVNKIKNGDRRLAFYFGERMAERLIDASWEDTGLHMGRYALNENSQEENPERSLLVLPVPLTKERQTERGYNQAAELARVVAETLQTRGFSAVYDEDVLWKRKETLLQKRLGFIARSENVAGAYHVHKRKECRGRTIVLVDDILTTGATGNECGKLLLSAGAQRVIFLVAASLPEKKPKSKE
ncbi:MAG: ComF family protein [Clostridia bacterium]|nr:ComF family protein [Clostridia bacterium]